MKASSKVFDLLEIDDLPESMAKRVRSAGLRRHDSRILSLFEIKKILTPTEIMVGLYRMYKLSRSIQSVHVALHKLEKDGLLKRVRKGIYEKV